MRIAFWPKWSVEEWRLLFNGFQALGAVTVASLAIYGLFFTSLPETIVRQLRADVADAKEELAGLRAERNRLNTSLETVNADLRAAAERSRVAEERAKTSATQLASTSGELEQARSTLTTERERIETLQVEANRLQTSSADARAKLTQLEADITRLSAERQNYLRAVQRSAFAGGQFDLALRLKDYKTAVTIARAYLEAPNQDAIDRDYDQRIDRVRRSDPGELRRLIEERLDKMRRELPQEVSMTFMLASFNGKTGNKFLETWTAQELVRVTQIARKTARDLVLEQFNSTGSFTQPDFAAFRQSLLGALQAKPALSQPLLVDRAKIELRGDVALAEIDRTTSTIGALEQFLEEFSATLKAAR